MGFIKKIWKDRISEFPTRRSLTKTDGTSELVTVARSEGMISEEGDAFSAENMNDLETRISNEFEEQNKNFTDKLDDIEAYIKGGFSMTIGNVLYEEGTAATAVTKELETTSPSLIYLDHCASYTVTANGTDVNAKVISKQGSYNRNSAIAILPKGNISITIKGTAQTGAGCTLFELSL